MIDFSELNSLARHPGLVIAVDVTLKGTVLLVLAWVAHVACGPRRALVRSACWNACLIGLLAIPIASWALPPLRLSLLPAARQPVAPVNEAGDDVITSFDAAPMVANATNAGRVQGVVEPGAPELANAAPAPFQISSRSTARHGWQPSWPEIAVGIYLLVAAVLVVKLVFALAGVIQLRRECERVDERRWVAALERWHSRLRITRPVTLAQSARVSVPVVLGWHRPAIVLPGGLVQSAGTDLADAVILHELAHVERGDYGWNLVYHVVRIIYWPHPMVWGISRLLGTLREQACDDLCVHAIGSASIYGRSLVEVASGLVRRPGPAIGMAMARTTRLGCRLDWIAVSRGMPHCRLRWPARWAVASIVVISACVLGALELARKGAKAAEQTAGKAAGTPAAEAPAMPPAIEIRVVASDKNEPLAGARVRASLDFDEPLLKTDREGRLQIDLSKLVFRDRFGVDVWADGYVQQRYYFGFYDDRNPKIPDRLTITLLPGDETLGGKVITEEGQPISGARVVLWGHLGEKKEPHESGYMIDTVTDSRGQWRCGSCRKMKFAYLYLHHPDFVADEQTHPRVHGEIREGEPAPPDDPAMKALRDFSDVQVMARGVAIAGTITDAQGRPIANAEIGRLEANHLNTFSWDLPRTWTDADGRFRFPHVQPGKYALQVKARGHAPELRLITARQGADVVSIALKEPRLLSGRFVDTQKNPIADVHVVINRWRGSSALGVNIKTDADGRFRWEDAPADAVQLIAVRDGYDGADQTVTAGAGEFVRTLKQTLTIRGRLSDAASDEAIEGGTVEVAAIDSNRVFTDWSRREGANAFSGNFTATLDAEGSAEYRLRITAQGYEPFETRAFRSTEKRVNFDVKLKKKARPRGTPISGAVRQPDGKPLAGADVAITYPRGGDTASQVQIENGQIKTSRRQTTARTDAQGRFLIAREPDPAGGDFAVVVVHPNFYAEVTRAEFEADPTIKARPWGRIEGVVRLKNAPAAGTPIRYFGDRLGNPDVPSVSETARTQASGTGSFVFERVIPGEARVFVDRRDNTTASGAPPSVLVEVRPGETAHAQLGGKGRTIFARVGPPDGFDPKADYTVYSVVDLRSDRPIVPYPKELLAIHDESMTRWGKTWWSSAEGREYRRNYVWFDQMSLRPDGTIRVDDVPPGDYRLTLTFSANPLAGLTASPSEVAHATRQFTVAPIAGDEADQPIDLGELRPEPKALLEVGQAAPAFDVETLDGDRRTLAGYRGKFLLLDFWATWCGPCIAEIPALQKVHEQFGKDPRFAMLSLSLDAEKEAPRKFVKERGLGWTQGFLGDHVAGGVQDAFHVEAIPAIFLIGPDGKVVARDLRASGVEAAITQALGAR